MPELTQFESGKSTIRYLPANGTAASDRSAVSALSALLSPPARMSASVRSISTSDRLARRQFAGRELLLVAVGVDHHVAPNPNIGRQMPAFADDADAGVDL